jgi:beta-1,4-mannosyltransferase
MKNKIFFYPIYFENKVFNPYCENFVKTLIAKGFDVINTKVKSNNVINFLRYDSDIYILNWIENLPERRFGVFQSFIFLLVLNLFLSGKFIIWVVHNKTPHSGRKDKLVEYIYKTLSKRANLVVFHAKEGIDFFENKYNFFDRKKSFYYPHPIINYEKLLNLSQDFKENKKIDILIWGRIAPYKGILEFLRMADKRGILGKYKVTIAGIFDGSSYSLGIKKYKSISIIDKKMTFQEIGTLVRQSKIVLFPYFAESILSSGVLADTLSFGGTPIGINKGAFKDMAELGLAITRIDLKHIVDDIENIIKSSIDFDCFNLDNLSWELFIENLLEKVLNK